MRGRPGFLRDRSNRAIARIDIQIHVDTLSDVLALLKPTGSFSAGLDAGGEWAVRFPPHDGIKFLAVTRGTCWVSVDDDPHAVRVEEGDCFLLTRGRPFQLASDRALPPIESRTIYAEARDRIATCNGGGEFFVIGGRFIFDGAFAPVLFGALPAIVHVHEASTQASVLRWAIGQLTTELRDRQPGGVLVSDHLAHIMIVQVLRLYLSGRPLHRHGLDGGWLAALTDRQIGSALGAMHADPARRWTLEDLGRIAGMSRSTFAQRFKHIVGASPLDYLTRWRMLIAGDRLRGTSDTIATIAQSLGYESDSAFSTAFKKIMSRSPKQYRIDAPRP
jgi:AraC-like DNA-binding protein